MPLVTVTATPILGINKREFGELLCGLTAKCLSCKDGKLTVEEIEVRFREMGQHDINASDLMIEIFANDYPDRRANIQERTVAIAAGVRGYLSTQGFLAPSVCGGTNFVWVLLAPAGFVHL